MTLKITTSAILTAVGVVLSYLNPFAYIVIFNAKINPFAHLINAIAGVLLGPGYAIITATSIATIRLATGTGTVLAFPGGISGALVVGVVREILLRVRPRRVNFAAFAEPLGTVFIGGTLAQLIIPTVFGTYWWLFALSCIPGCILGWVVLKVLDREGISATFLQTSTKAICEKPESIEVRPVMGDEPLLQKFKEVLKASQRVKKAEVADYLGITERELFSKLMMWQHLGFKIDGDFIIVENLDSFINALDQQFTEWEDIGKTGKT